MQFRGKETKGSVFRDFLKYSGREKFVAETGGRAELTHKPWCL